MARVLILHQPPHRAVIRSNHFEPYIQADITPFFKKYGKDVEDDLRGSRKK